MQIPVLVCGDVRNSPSLNPIRLTPGRWMMMVEGWQDTIFYPLPGSIHELEHAKTMQVEIVQAGTERSLTIYFEKVP